MSAQLSQPADYPRRSAAARAGSLAVHILWTAIPIGTLGLCAWAPALFIALRRRSPAAWWWLAGLATGTACECVLMAVVPGHGHGGENTAAGAFLVIYLFTATGYAWLGYGAGPAAKAPTLTTPKTPANPPNPAVPTVQAVPPAAADSLAAEIQADLRELRGLLGGGDAQ